MGRSATTPVVPASGGDLHDCPPELAAALGRREASVADVERDEPRIYIRATAPEGDLFAWYSIDARDRGVLAYEAETRARVGGEGALRAPQILDLGPNWRVEPAIAAEPLRGAAAIAAAAGAAAALAQLDLPEPPRGVRGENLLDKLKRRARTARSPLPVSDVLRAARLYSGSTLPATTSHGCFYAIHVFLSGGAVWVIDWELAAPRPAGFDLMQLWTDLEDEADRERLFEAAVALVGPKHRDALLKLRYVVLVRTIATKLAEPEPFYRDPEGARALMRLLPAARDAARAAV